ncbi:PREDICTED: E3 ubiquitin-protein ligase NEURL3 [Chrysochloris asiatica]|uniref:E3 ubiquitin-protein ligase NEURL3 n=1 Tax=Chrysochloris asiatica TaxID=185453 RepID=A0A9B0U9B0_CHRAS|nr:PREDICTED: E3 ubiquitin-protein ligase NEURL3 [Chrysochloris asiatica]
MEAQLCSEAGAKTPEALRFHAETKGTQVSLETQRCMARCQATFHGGIVFSQQSLKPGECVALRVLRDEDRWCGDLRVGFTRLDPARVPAPSLPPFVCSDLEEQSQTWVAVLPEPSRGQVFAKVNSGPWVLLRKGVLMGTPLWAVMDIYGTTKAIELLGKSTLYPMANPPPTTTPWTLSDNVLLRPEARGGEECTICFDHTTNTHLLPCGHSHFCNSYAWRVYMDTDKCPVCCWEIEAVTLVKDPLALKSEKGS